VSLYQVLALTGLGACLFSFGWGARAFFVQPHGATAGMRAIIACSGLFGLLHACAILLARDMAPGRTLAAVALYSASLGLFWWAIQTNRRRPLSAVLSPDPPVHLVQDGPYQYVRHPFYCSYMLTWVAGLVATFQLWLLPTVLIMLGIYLRAATMEERKFAGSSFAAAYEEYQRRTGRLAPNPFKLRSRN
jgi:protein-S-isoprenylcysteine O-methyltransferase Ste14